MIIGVLRKVHNFTTGCAPTPLQEAMAAVIGLPDSYYQWLQAFYASRRARMLGIHEKHGFKYAVPEGAYYVMADFRHWAAAMTIWRSPTG